MAKKPYKLHNIVAIVVLSMLILSLIFGITGMILSSLTQGRVFGRENIEYVKITLQCIVGLIAWFLPSLIERQLKITFFSGIHIMYVIFLFLAIILGEVSGYYRRFFHWDTVLHTLSGAMLSAFGFSIIDTINRSEKINLGLSDWFMSFFAFCFAAMLDTVWEIFEFIIDAFLDLNLQQYRLPDGTVLIGHYAVADTMKDLIADVLGALFVCIVGYLILRRRRKRALS